MHLGTSQGVEEHDWPCPWAIYSMPGNTSKIANIVLKKEETSEGHITPRAADYKLVGLDLRSFVLCRFYVNFSPILESSTPVLTDKSPVQSMLKSKEGNSIDFSNFLEVSNHLISSARNSASLFSKLLILPHT